MQFSAKHFPEKPEDGWEKTYNDVLATLFRISHDWAEVGVRVTYRCLPPDFAFVNGASLVSRLFARDDAPDNIGLQLDTYWLHYGRTDPGAYSLFPVHSVHLNERDNCGRSCVLGTHEEKCANYIRALVDRESTIDWILENDPSDEEARHNSIRMIEIMGKCSAGWASFWSSL